MDNTNNFNKCNKELSNVSELMKRNLLKELDAQNKRISEIENKRKQRDALVSEIHTKSKEIATTKKAKKHLKEISKKVHCDVPLFVKKNEKLNEERLF